MPAWINNGGTWSRVSKVWPNLAGTYNSISKGWVKVAGTWVLWYTLAILDSFTRTTATSLGNTDTGSAWTALRGTWYANGTQAQCNDASSNNSIASVSTGSSNGTTYADVVSGTGVVFWAQDANNWWAAISYNNTSTYTYGCSYSCTACLAGYVCTSCPQYSCTNCTSTSSVQDHTYNTSSGGLVSTNGGSFTGVVYASDCTQSNPTYSFGSGVYVYSSYYTHSCTSSTSGGTYPSCSCGTTTTYVSGGTYPSCACGSTPTYSSGGTYPSCSCGVTASGCSTGTTYNYYLRIIKSVAGTVSTATTDLALTGQPSRISVTTASGNIVATALDGTGATMGTINFNPVSPTISAGTGIIKAISDYNQGSTVDNFYTAAS